MLLSRESGRTYTENLTVIAASVPAVKQQVLPVAIAGQAPTTSVQEDTWWLNHIHEGQRGQLHVNGCGPRLQLHQ